MYRYCSLVSAADDITAPFTSQTSPVYPTVIFTALLVIRSFTLVAWLSLAMILKLLTLKL
jgi:hypothetical protein